MFSAMIWYEKSIQNLMVYYKIVWLGIPIL